METEPKRKRRWFQFSLRSLLIGVMLLAVLCAYVGWQAKIVRERNAMRAQMKRRGTETVDFDDVVLDRSKFRPLCMFREWMGDKALFEAYVTNGELNSPYVLRIKELFPEATFCPPLIQEPVP
jgi:hypothetical protein